MSPSDLFEPEARQRLIPSISQRLVAPAWFIRQVDSHPPLMLLEATVSRHAPTYGPRHLAAWRYLVSGPGARVGVVGSIDSEHRTICQDVFDEIVDLKESTESSVDGVLLTPGSTAPSWLPGHRARGGWVVQLGGKRLKRQEQTVCYGVYPSLAEPRFILPMESLSAAMALYTPSRKSVQAGLRMVANTPLHHGLRLVGDRMSISGINRDNRLVPPSHHLAISTGTTSAYHTATLLDIDPDGRRVGYAKLASRPLAQAAVQVERDTLERLNSLNLSIFEVPSVLRDVSWGRERGFFQCGPSWNAGPWQAGLSEQVLDGLGELFEKTRVEKTLEQTVFWRQTVEWVESLLPHLDEQWRQRIQELVIRCRQEASDTPQPAGLAHGDFIRWNLKGDGNRVFVFDWEHAVLEAPPFYDLLYWMLLEHHYLKDDRSPLAPLIEGDGPFGAARTALEQRLGLRYERRHLRLAVLRLALVHLRAWTPGYEAIRIYHQRALSMAASILEGLDSLEDRP